MRLESLGVILDQLGSDRSPAAAEHLAQAVVSVGQAAACRVWLVGPGDSCHRCPLSDDCRDRRECLHLAGSSGANVGNDGASPRHPLASRVFGQVASTRIPLICNHPACDGRMNDAPQLTAAGITCCTGWPLVCEDRLIGVMAIFSRESLDDDALKRIHAFAQRSAALLAGVMETHRLRQRVTELEQHLAALSRDVLSSRHHEQILGTSLESRTLRERIEYLAGRHEPLLMVGPPGAGKELSARALHAHGPRRQQPFLRLTCREVREAHLEAELFGVTQGSGSTEGDRAGLLELVQGGTLYLRHVDTMPLILQERLLTALRGGRASRVGADTTYPVRARAIGSCHGAPTHTTPLLSYLSQHVLHVPSLAERREDIPLLVEHNLRRFARCMGRPVTHVDPVEMKALCEYDWPGNVRELIQVVERAVLLAQGSTARCLLPARAATPMRADEALTLEDVERAHIVRVLRQTGGTIQGTTGAAALLGLRPSTLRSRMAKLNIPRNP